MSRVCHQCGDNQWLPLSVTVLVVVAAVVGAD